MFFKILRMIALFIGALIGFRAGSMCGEEFKSLKWYDKIFRIFLIFCWCACIAIMLAVLWESV